MECEQNELITTGYVWTLRVEPHFSRRDLYVVESAFYCQSFHMKLTRRSRADPQERKMCGMLYKKNHVFLDICIIFLTLFWKKRDSFLLLHVAGGYIWGWTSLEPRSAQDRSSRHPATTFLPSQKHMYSSLPLTTVLAISRAGSLMNTLLIL